MKLTIPYGDASLDGQFDSCDLVFVFQRSEYEDGIVGNSVWADGDWNDDGEFGSSDVVVAFQGGLYEMESGLKASRIAAVVDWLFARENARKATPSLRG